MAFKDVLVPVLSVQEGECALRAAEIVADLVDARVSAVFLKVIHFFVRDFNSKPTVFGKAAVDEGGLLKQYAIL